MCKHKYYEITDENNIPQELLDARASGKTIAVYFMDWIKCNDPAFRCGLTYAILDEVT